jgi:WXG100 family type VII secretion target
MPAIHIRIDHDQVGQMAQMFSKNSSDIQQVARKVKSAQETLSGGDWIGVGETKFTQEMENDVNPALARLSSALEEASKMTKQAGKIMEEADEEMSRSINVNITIRVR